jgi:hypothetical protein
MTANNFNSTTSPKKNICNLCGRSYSKFEQLRTHTRDRHPLFNWRGEIFPYAKVHLALRETIIPTTSPKKNICNLCGISYSPPERLQTHIRKEHQLLNPRNRLSHFTKKVTIQ